MHFVWLDFVWFCHICIIEISGLSDFNGRMGKKDPVVQPIHFSGCRIIENNGFVGMDLK